MSGRAVFVGVAAGIIAAAVVAGFVVMGTPAEARALRLDTRRVDDLSRLARDIDVFWSRRAALPISLEALSLEDGLGRTRLDPESGAPYLYRVLEDERYELCAEFATESTGARRWISDQFWVHRQGQQCYELTVEPLNRTGR